MNKKVLEYIELCEGWKVAIKNLHWSASNLSQHKLCDDIADAISEFEDLVSEVEQSISGKIKKNGFTPKSYEITSLKSFVDDVISSSKDFLGELEKMGDNYVGIKSECETFIGTMQRNSYLVDFTLKEGLKNRLREKINESMPKNPMKVGNDEFDKFIGRRPKSMKARINQIYKIVKKYGIDSRKYHDEHWQAIEDYYRAITSLGCEVELKPCASLSHADSIESDGGYTDYDEYDHMPRSKQYAIKIMFDDGMNIEGYVKCMAAGTVEDPFSSYDTCMVLWPRSGRVLESKTDDLVLSESELKDVINESVNILLEDIIYQYKGKEYKFKDKKELTKFINAQRGVNQSANNGKKPSRNNVGKSGMASQSNPKELANGVKVLLYDKALKSVYTFITHGERSYGPEAMKKLRSLYINETKENLFSSFVSTYLDINRYVNDIEKWGINDEYAVYERASKISLLLTDLCEILADLSNATSSMKKRGLFDRVFANNNRVLIGSGNGRELGLFDLVFAKSAKVLNNLVIKLQEKANLLDEISKNGRNPLDYTDKKW